MNGEVNGAELLDELVDERRSLRVRTGFALLHGQVDLKQKSCQPTAGLGGILKAALHSHRSHSVLEGAMLARRGFLEVCPFPPGSSE